jgi:predicted unusual protein kinase regulating ubiquinone biosynthesis (AarF/ABC1/UbiB family)
MADATTSQDRLHDALLRAADLLAATTTTRVALQGLAGALDPAVLPAELRGPVLERLAAAGEPEPLSWREVEARLKRAWGGPVARTLDALDPDPVAVTPSAQVHRGTLHGDEVAVKVRRPGVVEALRGDLALLDAVAPLFAGLAPGVDVVAIVREVRERALDELDLEHQAGVQRGFHRALRRHGDLHVPAPVTDLSHEQVLVSAWVDGTPVRALAAGGAGDRRRAAELAVRFFLGAGAHGTAHADPHPDDVLLLGDGRLAILDFGAVAPVSHARLALFADLLEALANGDDAAAAAALGALGWFPAADAATVIALAQLTLGPLLVGPAARLDGPALARVTQAALDEAPQALALLPRAGLPAGDVWPLRGAGALALLLARLDVEADWPALATRALRDGW